LRVDAESCRTSSKVMFRIPRSRAGDMYNHNGVVYIPYQGTLRLKFEPITSDDPRADLIQGLRWTSVTKPPFNGQPSA
jgi:hypothetical protein